jgi:hypothetical protein
MAPPSPLRRKAAKEEMQRPQEAESADFGYSDELSASLLDEDAPAAGEAAPAPTQAREITARIVVLEETSLTLELVVPEPGLELDLEGATATVRLSDGTEVEALIVIERSTHPGSYAAGIVLRIMLVMPQGRGTDVGEATVFLGNGVTIRAKA